jgi:hypothetical protein
MNDPILAGKAALEEFKKTGTFQIPENMTHNNFAVWRCTFQDDENLPGWKLIALEELRRESQAANNRCKEAIEAVSFEDNLVPSRVETIKKGMLSSAAMLAVICVGNYKPEYMEKENWRKMFSEIYPEAKQIWLNAFKDFPEFESLMEEYSWAGK